MMTRLNSPEETYAMMAADAVVRTILPPNWLFVKSVYSVSEIEYHCKYMGSNALIKLTLNLNAHTLDTIVPYISVTLQGACAHACATAELDRNDIQAIGQLNDRIAAIVSLQKEIF